jgi:hypothetical protein
MIKHLSVVMTLFACAFASAAEVAIVRDGRAGATIVTSASPAPAETLAAEEIARYVRQISGADLKSPQADAKLVIRIETKQPAVETPLGDDRYTVTTGDNGITISGSNPRATLVGAYRFLDALGCRFLAPQYAHYDGSAEIVPKKQTLTFAGDITAAAHLRHRKLYVEEGHSHDTEKLRQMIEWMPKVGYNVLVIPTDYQGRGRVKWDNWRDALTPQLQKRGLIIEVGGHGYQNFLNAGMEGGSLFQKHPDWFGQDKQGKRRREHGRVFCTSNPDAVAYLTKNLCEYVRARPEIKIFDFWPPDGATWCECEACAALGPASDRQSLLVNHVRRAAARVRPDLKMEAIAYQRLIVPPEKHQLDQEVLVDFCPIRQNFEFHLFDENAPKQRPDVSSPTNHEYVAGLKAWRSKFAGDISIYSYYRRYAWDSLPLVLPHFMQAELKFYRSIPVQGISVYSEPGDWYAYELNHYILPHLAWDADRDVDALIGKFCDARYGSAAPQALEAFAIMADVVHQYCSVPFVSLKPRDAIEQAHAKLTAAARALERAKEQASDDRDDAIKRNIDRQLLAMEYASRDLEIQALRARGAEADEIRRRGTDLHQFLTQNADAGVFLVKNHRLALPRLLAHYGVK